MTDPETFTQKPPRLGNQYIEDRVLRSYLERVVPDDVRSEIEPGLDEMGELSGGRLYEKQLADRWNEPRLTQWSAWGERVDEIELTPLWREAEVLASTRGVVAAAYERQHERFSRLHQFALAYLFTPSTDIYSCPLAMTDGAAHTLLGSGNRQLIDRAVPHLTSRDPSTFWTSGQWMTETTGGSDVGLSETEAHRDDDGRWRLWGRKWFTSATTSQMALTLARPAGNPEGGRGLALFYVETRDEDGGLADIRIDRLKDKLGTRKVPTAELHMLGTPAVPVMGLTDGVRNIAPMLNVTRTWNAVSSAALLRRGLALARDYAGRRRAFGATLAEQPLHVDTLAGVQAEFEGVFLLTFRLVELLGRLEADDISEPEARLFRILTPIVKLTTAKQAVAGASEILESFGGAGYLEDTGLPMLLRDAQVLPIWEGTTNVLSLDTLRAVEKDGFPLLVAEVERAVADLREASLVNVGRAAREALGRAGAWLETASVAGRPALEAGARRFALTVGRSVEAALLAEQAQWSLDHEGDGRPAAAARRFTAAGLDHTAAMDAADARALANEESSKIPTPVG